MTKKRITLVPVSYTHLDVYKRQDLLMTMSEGLNRVTDKMEKLGLVILKDENGEYVARGNRKDVYKRQGHDRKPWCQ